MTVLNTLTKALQKLYPNGQAFRFFASQWKSLNVALLEEPVRVTEFSKKVRASGIPGILPNEALEDWEELFQLQDNVSLTDAERNDRIKARFNAIGGQGVDYLQDVFNDQFQLLLGVYTLYNTTCGDGVSTCGNPVSTCGNATISPSTNIDITIYENLIPYNPALIPGLLIIRDINDNPSEIPTDSDYWGLFWFIYGPNGLGSWLELPANRKNEFIETVLKYKPVNTWVIAQINFV